MVIERSGFQKEERRLESENTTLPELETPEESIPRSLVPWNMDDDRSRYLGLRASGFTIREALGLIGKHKSTVSKWRLDPKFLKLEDNLRKDAEGNVHKVPMDSQDFQYLMKLRPFYTPQQLAAIQQLFGTQAPGGEGDGWMEMALRRTRTETEEMTVRTRHRQESNIAPIRDE